MRFKLQRRDRSQSGKSPFKTSPTRKTNPLGLRIGDEKRIHLTYAGHHVQCNPEGFAGPPYTCTNYRNAVVTSCGRDPATADTSMFVGATKTCHIANHHGTGPPTNPTSSRDVFTSWHRSLLASRLSDCRACVHVCDTQRMLPFKAAMLSYHTRRKSASMCPSIEHETMIVRG